VRSAGILRNVRHYHCTQRKVPEERKSHARGLFPTVAPCTRFSSRRNRAHNGIYSETDSVQDRDKKKKVNNL